MSECNAKRLLHWAALGRSSATICPENWNNTNQNPHRASKTPAPGSQHLGSLPRSYKSNWQNDPWKSPTCNKYIRSWKQILTQPPFFFHLEKKSIENHWHILHTLKVYIKNETVLNFKHSTLPQHFILLLIWKDASHFTGATCSRTN